MRGGIKETKWKPSWSACKLTKRAQTEETHTVIRTKVSKVLMNHQSDHVVSSCLLLLSVLQGAPGLFKNGLFFRSLQLTHGDELHHSTGRLQLPEGLCRTASSGPIPAVLNQSFDESKSSCKEEGVRQGIPLQQAMTLLILTEVIL